MTGAERVRATRLADTVRTDDWAAVSALITQIKVAHVGFVMPGQDADQTTTLQPQVIAQPCVIPIAAAVDGDTVLLHGSTGSRWLRVIAGGGPVSAAVTALDGLVVARSAFESSMRYRSAVLFGRCSPVEGEAKDQALDVITDALIPGRVAEVRRPTARELAATLVLRLDVEDFSVKISDAWPEDPQSDVAGPAWAGVIPILTSYDTPLAAPDLTPGIEEPQSVRRLR